MTTEVHDSPAEWVNDHIQKYVETDGAEGHYWRGVPTLLLTTKGRKSGELRRTALIYGEQNGSYFIVASQGGRPTHPSWYLNLEAEPLVHVQVAADKFDARARTADDEERKLLWPLMAEIWPDYNEYQKKTDRQIPIVVLDRV